MAGCVGGCAGRGRVGGESGARSSRGVLEIGWRRKGWMLVVVLVLRREDLIRGSRGRECGGRLWNRSQMVE